MADTYDLVISFNEKYRMPAEVMLRSFYENLSSGDIVHVWVLHLGLSDKVRAMFVVNVSDICKVQFINMTHAILKDLPVSGHISHESYLRVFAYLYLPEHVKRALYIDVDIIVNKSMRDFYFQPFDNALIVACEDFWASHNDETLYANLEMALAEPYFNAGVLLLDMEAMRAIPGLQEQIVCYIEKKRDKLMYHDQDILNGFFRQNVKIITDTRYNCFVTAIATCRQSRKAARQAYIIHYVERKKPWNEDYVGFLQGIFWEYAALAGYDRKAAKVDGRRLEKAAKLLYTIAARMKKKHMRAIHVRAYSK